MGLQVATFNVQNINANVLAVQDVLKNVDILAVQEHWLFNFEQQKLYDIDKNFTFAAKSVDDNDTISPFQKPRGYGGVAVFWRKSLDRYIKLLPDGSDRLICIELNIGLSMYCFINTYLPCRGSYSNEDYKAVLDEIQETLLKYGDSHIIVIMGDLNASLTRSPPSARDKVLIEFCQRNNISIEVPIANTFFHVNGVDRSQIDYFLTYEKDKHLVKIYQPIKENNTDPLNVSDHIPVYASIVASWEKQGSQHFQSKNNVHRYITFRTDWTKVDKLRYKEITNSNTIINEITDENKLMDAISNLTNTITTASQECLIRPKRNFKKSNKGLDVWNPRISELVKRSKVVHLQWKDAGRPSNICPIATERKAIKRQLRSEIRRSTRALTDQHYEDIMKARSEDTKLFHKLVKLQRSKTTTMTSLLVMDDDNLTDPEDICDGFRKHFNKLAATKDDPDFSAQFKSNADFKVAQIDKWLNEQHHKMEPATTEEVQKLIASFKNGKSQDCFDVTAEHLKYAGPNVVLLLTRIINYILDTASVPEGLLRGILTPIPKKNKDKTSADNYRGITVTPILCKLLEKAWLRRANQILLQSQNSMQSGFTQGKSPSNAALMVTESITEALETKKPIYVTLLDVSKAFDVVDHGILFDELYEAGVDGDLWLTFRQFYSNPTTSIKWGTFISESFKVEQGVRQGGVSSAPIYKVFTNRLLDQLSEYHGEHRIGAINIPAPTCADDMAILSNSPTDTQLALDIVSSYAKDHRYKINASKSATISYGSVVNVGLEIDGENIPYSEESMHLGISRNINNVLNVDDRIQLARRTMYALMGAGLHGEEWACPSCLISHLDNICPA